MDNIIPFKGFQAPNMVTIRPRVVLSSKSIHNAMAAVSKASPALANANYLGDMAQPIVDEAQALRHDVDDYITAVKRDTLLAAPYALHIQCKWEFGNFAHQAVRTLGDCLIGSGREFEEVYQSLRVTERAFEAALDAIKNVRGA